LGIPSVPKEKKPPPEPVPNGLPEGLTVHERSKTELRDIELITDSAHLSGYVRIIFHTSERQLTAVEMLSFLNEQKVKVTEEGRANIDAAVANAKDSDGALGPLVVATGRPAVNGTDGNIEWLVPNPVLLKQEKAAVGRVDYRELNKIVNLRQGQKILTLSEPTKGEPGEDIFGTVIPSQPGRPVSIRRGKNVDVTEDGREFFAQVTGMLEVAGDQILIEPLLIIQNDVDMSVGNINFIGPVKIARDVLDGFKIKAGKEIEVGGMVEGSALEAGSYIRIQGGVAGKLRSKIVCKGNLEAKYLNEVSVEAGGDVVVANSITNSTVKSRGKITVTNGGIRGSNVIAQKGLRSPEIGSELGVRTIVIVGVDYHLKDKFANIERELAAVREAVEKIETALGPLLADVEITATLPPEKSDIARRLMGQLDVLVQRGDELAAKRSAMLAKMEVGSDMFIEVGKKICAGVVMQIGTCRRTFELDVSGPVKLHPDIENASIKVSR